MKENSMYRAIIDLFRRVIPRLFRWRTYFALFHREALLIYIFNT